MFVGHLLYIPNYTMGKLTLLLCNYKVGSVIPTWIRTQSPRKVKARAQIRAGGPAI